MTSTMHRRKQRLHCMWFRLRRSRERGSGGEALELVIITPAIVLVIVVCIALGRYSLGTSKVDQAAAAAARAASQQHNPAAAQEAATTAAAASLDDSGVACQAMDVEVDTAGFAVPAGQPATVTATVACTVDWSDLTIPGWPGAKQVTSSVTSPLDVTQERFS